jgi:hypothetical protein
VGIRSDVRIDRGSEALIFKPVVDAPVASVPCATAGFNDDGVERERVTIGRGHSPNRRPKGGSGAASRSTPGSEVATDPATGTKVMARACSDGSAPTSRPMACRSVHPNRLLGLDRPMPELRAFLRAEGEIR